MKNLVIVESPAKAKTIEKYLGSDYTVKSSFGHIRDLPKKGLSVDKENNFEPTYEVSPDKKKVVSDLKKAAAKAEKVWLASDEDREGEAIAWHLSEALKLPKSKTKRIVFHEITKPAILRAIQTPRDVDMALVHAQQARRVLDRLVGYELSPVLWRKVRAGLSAGRVQSVAVRLIVEREREIRGHKASSDYKITAEFTTQKHNLPAELPEKFKQPDTAQKFLEDAAKANFSVAKVETKPGSRNPSPPFTTSTLQQEAARRLGFSVKQTMVLAQRLYENGHISYMRTDSVVLSETALASVSKYIEEQYGKTYAQRRQFVTKTEGAQEAHEAIRPTHPKKTEAGDDANQRKLYKLIWQRTLASQMAPAKVEKTEVWIKLDNRREQLLAKGEVLLFDGFMKVYGGTKDDVILPPLKSGDKLQLITMTARENFGRPPARYSEASLVKKLEELGIGRPSTYAPTISTVQDRGYVEKGDIEGNEREVRILQLVGGKVTNQVETEAYGADRNKLLPTSLAEVTSDFLLKYFAPIVDYDFTAKAEDEFDEIERGKIAWNKMITEFYKDQFHPLIEKSAHATRSEASQARLLGKDPKTGQPIYARYGRYGPMLQRGETESETKPDFAPLPTDSSLETVSLTAALEMFRLPRVVGKTTDGKDIAANIGRYGPYVQVEKLFVSIKDLDPFKITEKEARQAISAKQKAIAKRVINTFEGSKVQVLNGPYGPYVTNGKKNARIPKEKKPEKLTLAECEALLAASPSKKARFKKKIAKT